MCAALHRVLAIDEGVVLLATLVGMGQGDLDILAREVDDRIERFDGHIVGQQVVQTVLRQVFLAIIHQGETRVEVGIVAHHGFDELVAEVVVLE